MAEDTNNAKWNQLQEMRKAKGEVPPTKVEAPPPVADPAAVNAEQTKLEAEAAAPKGETPPVEAKPAESPPPVADAKPTTVEIEIDGQKVNVDPAIAAAFSAADKIKKDATSASERAALKAEITAELKAAMPPPVEKTAAQIATEKALAESTRLSMPDESLMLTDPKAFKDQLKAYLDQETKSAADTATESVRAELSRRDATARQTQEQQARDSLRQQFYAAYPSFKGSDTIVDTILGKKWDEIMSSGRLGKQISPQEAEAMRTEAFADVAVRSTREIVKVMNAGKQVMPPAPMPPTLASSAPAKAPAPKKEEPEKPREKYPKGSVSALLASQKAARIGAGA